MTLRKYVFEEENTNEKVYVVQDTTGAILNVFTTKEEAEEDVKTWPIDAKAKVVSINKNEIETQ